MPVSLLKSAYEVKQKLLAFGLSQFAENFEALKQQIYPQQPTADELLALKDWFVLEHLLADRRTVLSHYIEQCRIDADRVIAEQWGLVIQGVFHVRQMLSPHHFELMNLVNDVTYQVASNPEDRLELEKGEYIVARLLPIQDYHMFTGLIDRLPTRKKNEIYELVAEIQTHDPKMAFIDNIERIQMAYEIQREEHTDFVAFFGDDEIILSGQELEDKLKEFYHYRYFQKKQAGGNTIAKTFQDRYHQPPLPPHFDFLENVQAEKEIGVIYDLTEGLVFLLRYGAFLQVFTRPDFKRIKNYKQIVIAYLEDPHISSLPFRRMAARYPEQATEIFKILTKRKHFDLDKDLAKLIQRYKPMEQLTHLTPSTIPAAVRSKTYLRALKARAKW